MDTILQVNNLCKDFGGFKLNKVNFSLPKGSIMGFIGENGAGKTTTIKLMLNLLKKDGGAVQVFGQDSVQNERQIKQQIGVVLDESTFHDQLTAGHISKIMAHIYKNWDDRTYSLYLDRFQLPKGKIIKEFSRGMKMKLSIAAALSHDPKLLILDEATSGLDPVVRNEILDVFLEFIQNEEHSVFMSSHITSDLEKIADYITFIHQGSIVFSDSKDELLDSYGILKCGADDFKKIDESDMVSYRKSSFGYEALIKDKNAVRRKYPSVLVEGTTLEEIMLLYVKGEEK